MFDTGTTRLFVPVCALAVAGWMALAPGPTPAYIVGWALAGLMALHGMSALIQRAMQASPSAARVLHAAERINAERIAAPPRTPARRSDDASS